MNLLTDLPAYDNDTHGAGITTLRVLVECEKGSVHKYEYTPEGYMTIVRDLSKKYKYPFAYGCVPQTLAEDNDPLDAIVISDEMISAGTIINCNVLGIIRTVDNGEQDDKLICVPYYVKSGTVDIKKILHYLKNYKWPHQDGTVVGEVLGPDDAKKLISESIENYNKKV